MIPSHAHAQFAFPLNMVRGIFFLTSSFLLYRLFNKSLKHFYMKQFYLLTTSINVLTVLLEENVME